MSREGRQPASGSWHRRARQAIRRSIHLRLVLLFLVLALAMTVTFIGGVQSAFSVGWRDAARPLLADYVDRLVTEIGNPPSVERAQAIAQRLPIMLRIEGPQVQWTSHPADGQVARWRGGRGPWDDERGELLRKQTADGHTIEFSLNRAVMDGAHRSRAVWFTLGGLLLMTALAYAYVRRLLRPLDDIRQGALRFGAGDFGASIPVRHALRPDELGQLAATINTMGQDIHQMLEAKRALLLAISHELRSPLTRARLHTELLPATHEVQPQRDALLRDLGEMARLITDLLESERLAGRHSALHKESTDIGALARAVALEMKACHPDSPVIDLQIDASMPSVLVDATRMRLLMRNLLDNALRYGGPDQPAPQLHLRQTLARLEIEVRDFGSGVSDAQLDRLAEPFYRADTARQRSTGGVGLGLYLCQLVAQAHGGSLQLAHAQPGLRATAVLPLN